ncbi:MAG: fructosamine kinase family protein [Planctomycetota bacterium]
MESLLPAIRDLIPEAAEIESESAIGGSSFSSTSRLVIRNQDGSHRRVFLKAGHLDQRLAFDCERRGLELLSQSQTIATAVPIGVTTSQDRAIFLAELIETGQRDAQFYDRFGHDLACLHRSTKGTQIGLDHDNFLGVAPQLNTAKSSWLDFVAECRLGHQIRLGRQNRVLSAQLQRDVESIIDRLPDLLAGREDVTSLLHGDLWSGNLMCDSKQRPVIIDPAVYYGCREAEWGMIKLFGGCPPSSLAAYQSVWPFPDGWQRRVDVYVLVHLLNHLNIFGVSYADQCQDVAGSLLSA